MNHLSCLLFLVLAAPAVSQTFDQFATALAQVESGQNDAAVGDGGAALGRFQIHRCYWQDAVAFDRTIGGCYEDVRDPVYARKVIRAYFSRYAAKELAAGNWEHLARIHNGGPRIHRRQQSKAWDNTTVYWSKVRVALR